jgi:hypothetical protein
VATGLRETVVEAPITEKGLLGTSQRDRGIHPALRVSKSLQFIFHPVVDGATQFLL